MSAPLSKEAILFRQRLLACAGFYADTLDGRWGDKTEAADRAFHAEFVKIQQFGGVYDPRTETAIATLLPKAQVKARDFMRVAGPTCKLLSGTRTYAEQDVLFAQRPVVTRARGGHSNHNFGIAWDVGIFLGGHYLTGTNPAEEAEYDKLAVKIKAAVPWLEWGGDWHSIVDKPHYQLATDKNLDQVRAWFEAGKPFV